jgi:hypothetical protein
MLRAFVVIIFSLVLVGCGSPTGRYATTSITSVLPFGSSVEDLCKIKDDKYYELREWGSGYGSAGTVLITCSPNSFVEYDSENKTEIIAAKKYSGADKYYFAFENVERPLNCNSFTCEYGGGSLKFITQDIKEARRILNPKLMAEFVKEEKLKKEKEEKEYILKVQNEAKEELARKKSVVKLYERQYGSKCSSDKGDLDRYSSCLYRMRAEALEIEKAKEQQKELQGKLENSDIAKTCLGFGYKKGTEKYADCMKDLYLQQSASGKTNDNSSSYNSTYADQMLEIERAKAKALQDSADAQRNRNQSDAMLELSRRLLNNNNNTPAATTNQPLNCRSVRVGNTVQTQCY